MQLFCDSKREEVKAANPGAGFGETGKLLAAAWKECSPEDKAHFQEQSQVRQGFELCQTQVRNNMQAYFAFVAACFSATKRAS